ncbi:hypothetical protein IFT98_20865 [Pseudomonas sp. CFBP 8770]|uniref:DUF5710 domain-containing protein n=1 Tax=unclassified Pseudomonas TaxID=196821 RepID=UPI00177BCA8D|nr:MULTISPECIES: DUF5710 domain-containing protein [unclassified Pseudomonas]MBD8476552.1 hypothetical protein [Pseudomonas sp. CFBP 8773]MBD8649444.1 hypothetical protein [Pseudomonas sp. CFBP 8770]
MERINLAVPFSEKDEAKSFGARWDPSQKTWYIPEGVEIGPLTRWLAVTQHGNLEQAPEFSVRAQYYYVMESVSDCWACSTPTRVYSFKLPEQHEQFDHYVEEDEGEDFALTSNLGEWKCYGYRGTASNVSRLSPRVTKQIYRFTSRFKLAYSKIVGRRYWMNHCEHCEAKLGDFFMHEEPGGAFFPISPHEAKRMKLKRINDRFDADCSVGYATDDFFDCMQIRE